MKSLNRVAVGALTLSAFLAVAPAEAASGGYSQDLEGPKWEYQVVDAVVARPIGILATGAGAMVWGVSLPFSLLGGNAGEAADSLIGGPGRETFYRCLGCTSTGRRQYTADR
jgi:hypothetical protein